MQKAIHDGHARLSGEGKNEKVTYIAVNHTERYSDPEEKVRAEFWAELIYRYNYDADCIGVEVVVPDRQPNDRADLVIFTDNTRKRPYAVIECKKDDISDAEFDQAVEQVFGNGTWAKFRASYVMVVAGITRRAFDVSDKYGALEREQNIIADIPVRYWKPEEFKYVKNGRMDIEAVSKEELISALRTVVSHLEGINLNRTDLDTKGVAFEQFMDGFFKGDFGQYFTPREVISFAVEMLQPAHDDLCLDPACGSGGFLLYAMDAVRREAGEYFDEGTTEHYKHWHDFAMSNLFGIELNDSIARVAKMNMILHDDGHTNVISADSLQEIEKITAHNRGFGFERFDLILTNPPFGAVVKSSEKPYLPGYDLAYDWRDGARQAKLAEAEALLRGMDGFVLEQLGLKLAQEKNERKIFAMRFGAVRQRFDVDYHTPYFRALRTAIQNSAFEVVKLPEILAKPLTSGFAAGRGDQAEDETVGVPHVRPFNITPNGEFSLETIKFVPRESVNPADLLTKGEVLFNNTNSTEWVGKSAVFDGENECACSNHITRLFLKPEKAAPVFIAALFNALRSIGLFGLLSTNFNNQAGINSETLTTLQIPLPPLSMQKAIADELSNRREAARRLRAEAGQVWKDAKEKFENALL